MYDNSLQIRGAWLEINLDALRNNLKIVRSQVGEDVILMPVVKADAYGHGSIPCAKALLEAGADRFAIATLNEGVRLREAGINVPILSLGYMPPRQYELAIANDLAITVYDLNQAKEINQVADKLNQKAIVHIKVDSGFTRLGFMVNDQSVLDVEAISKLPNINIEGIYTHLAWADSLDVSYSEYQKDNFVRFVERCEQLGVKFPIRHIANSAAIINLPDFHMDLCRPGIMLYGCNPSDDVKIVDGIKPVMSVKAEIARLTKVPAGTKVGYGCTWTADRGNVIATIPLGYADGISRLQSRDGYVLVNGQRALIVGRICMDQFMIDVTDIKSDKPLDIGDIITVMGQDGDLSISADDLAQRMGTINYEILCMLGNRLPRLYLGANQ